MARAHRGRLATGVVLILFSLGGWLAEQTWNRRTEADARGRLLGLAYPNKEDQHDHKHDSMEALLLQAGQADGQRVQWLQSSPWGAEVWQDGTLLGRTPLPLPPSGGAPLELRTPWRKATVPAGETQALLGSNLLSHLLRLAGLAGLALVGLAFASRARSSEAPDEAEPIAESEPLAELERYGDYEMLELCGQGSMGTVYRARSTTKGDSRAYALKVLNPEWSQSDEFRQRFEREYQICRQLDSARVVRVHARGEKDGQLWMVMDFVSGPTLTEWLAAAPRTEQEILALTVEICEGLAYAHNLGVVHRDLKPDNIIIDSGSSPVITDFGLARSRHYATITQAHTVLGTPAYMAPEQIEGSTINGQADLYSLGCILYEALAGRPPFQGEAMEVVMAQLTRQPEPLSQHASVSQACERLVHRLLAKDKSQRYACADEVRQDLLAASKGSIS